MDRAIGIWQCRCYRMPLIIFLHDRKKFQQR
jgi:hypothetical protein